MGRKSKKRAKCIHITDSLHCTAGTNTTLQSNYIPIKLIIQLSFANPLLFAVPEFSKHIFLQVKDKEMEMMREDEV